MHRKLDLLKRRPSKLGNRDGDTDVNRCGGWSREKLERMDAKFVEAMQRAMTAQIPAAYLPPRKRRALDRKSMITSSDLVAGGATMRSG